MFVVNADQAGSRDSEDRIPAALEALDRAVPTPAVGFERTVGDEVQGVLATGADVVAASRALAASGGWHIAIGVGAVQTPLPASTRAARGKAFLAARRAAEAVKTRSPSVLVLADPGVVHDADDTVTDADTALRLLGSLWSRRSRPGWDAVAATEAARTLDPEVTLASVAQGLGITHQALSQRLRAASWDLETDALGTVARLLDRANTSVAHDASAGGAS